MTVTFASIVLLAGSAICLLAALGVLRLPDFFMRMHAATKAGVVGSGLVLISVAITDTTAVTWFKVGAAVLFLLLTTPVAGHLLGRAAYIGGAPLWAGTVRDDLSGVLPRGQFDRSAPAAPRVERVVLALAKGPQLDAAITDAIALARQHHALLCAVAIIDKPRLDNVGPVPIGALSYAQRIRDLRLAKARDAAAEAIAAFETTAEAAGIKWSIRLEEGRPRTVIQSFSDATDLIAVAPRAWFDQGVLDMEVNVVRRLGLYEGANVIVVGERETQ